MTREDALTWVHDVLVQDVIDSGIENDRIVIMDDDQIVVAQRGVDGEKAAYFVVSVDDGQVAVP